jgi:hypothetical protein
MNNVEKLYECITCRYATDNKYDWNKHINTKKHKQMCSTDVVVSKRPDHYVCIYCKKVYKFRSGLARHNKICVGTQEIEAKDEQIKSLQNLLEKSIENQTALINKQNALIDKVGNTYNNTISNNMTINLFLNQECKDAMNLSDFMNTLQLSAEDLDYTSKNGFIKGMVNIFQKNLKKISPLERPFHCSDPKKLQFFVKDENKWEEDNGTRCKIDESIKSISQKQIQKIKEWECHNPFWDKSDEGVIQYVTMVRKVMGGDSDDERNNNYLSIKKQIGKDVNINNVLQIAKN